MQLAQRFLESTEVSNCLQPLKTNIQINNTPYVNVVESSSKLNQISKSTKPTQTCNNNNNHNDKNNDYNINKTAEKFDLKRLKRVIKLGRKIRAIETNKSNELQFIIEKYQRRKQQKLLDLQTQREFDIQQRKYLFQERVNDVQDNMNQQIAHFREFCLNELKRIKKETKKFRKESINNNKNGSVITQDYIGSIYNKFIDQQLGSNKCNNNRNSRSRTRTTANSQRTLIYRSSMLSYKQKNADISKLLNIAKRNNIKLKD